ncbi:MAG: Nif3-like dinuclear metal center hexameric protein [Zavarzinella sp.]
MATVGEISTWLDQFAPRELAAEWDNTGLLMGDPNDQVSSCITCLTITPEVVREALEAPVQLIVTHHPVLFRGTKNLSTNNSEGKLLWPLAKAGIAVYSPHTRFDNATGGINDWIATQLQLQNIRPLRPAKRSAGYKIVVFVPTDHLELVAKALFQAGAGVIGDYEQCSFQLSGTGTFFGTESTSPVIGTKGQLERVSETRLEVVCPKHLLDKALRAMITAHPYEEVAYDVYPLAEISSTSVGEGRVGELPTGVLLGQFAAHVRQVLHAQLVQIVGQADRTVQKVAIACGAAGEFMRDAHRTGADLFLTGEMRFHDYLAANALGLALVLPGHYATERPAVEMLADRLRAAFPPVTCWASMEERDPVTAVDGKRLE